LLMAAVWRSTYLLRLYSGMLKAVLGLMDSLGVYSGARCENGVRTNLSVRGVTIYVNGGIAASVSIATIVQGRC